MRRKAYPKYYIPTPTETKGETVYFFEDPIIDEANPWAVALALGILGALAYGLYVMIGWI